MVLGCKGGGVGAGIRLDIPPCHGLKVHFGMVLGCNGDGEKRNSNPDLFFDLDARNKAAQAKQAKSNQHKPI